MKNFFAMGRGEYDPAKGMKDRFYLNNFGYYRGLSETIHVSRPQGRTDYQLLYVARGEIKLANGSIREGEWYVFPPKEEQLYTYCPMENSLYYWVHFTGYGVDEILEHAGKASRIHAANGRSKEVLGLFGLLSDALTMEARNTPYACSLLESLILLLSFPSMPRTPFYRARKLLEDTEEEISITALAELYRMTPEHFIRSFKRAHGSTPAHYRLLCRMGQAKQLLLETDLSVSGVAESCGFSDPLYFSRIFKKQTGMSPSHYRERYTMDE